MSNGGGRAAVSFRSRQSFAVALTAASALVTYALAMGSGLVTSAARSVIPGWRDRIAATLSPPVTSREVVEVQVTDRVGDQVRGAIV